MTQLRRNGASLCLQLTLEHSGWIHVRELRCFGELLRVLWVLNERAQFGDSRGSRVAPPRLRVGLPALKGAGLEARRVSEGTGGATARGGTCCCGPVAESRTVI